jgi:hypothetical protein
VHWPPQPNALPALQIPPLPAMQKDTRQRVESTSESEGDFENALDKTIMQSSDETEPPPTQKQTTKDGENLGKLHDEPFPRERNKYERKKE